MKTNFQPSRQNDLPLLNNVNGASAIDFYQIKGFELIITRYARSATNQSMFFNAKYACARWEWCISNTVPRNSPTWFVRALLCLVNSSNPFSVLRYALASVLISFSFHTCASANAFISFSLRALCFGELHLHLCEFFRTNFSPHLRP